MDWLTFTTKIIEALAWPVSIVVVFLIIRRPFLKSVPFLRKLKYSDVELEFSQEISSLRKDLSQASTEGSPHILTPSPIPERIIQLSAVSTRSAVLESWKEVETAVIEAAKRTKRLSDKMPNMSLDDLMAELEKDGGIRNQLASFYRRQKTLTERYNYSKGVKVDTEEALELIDVNLKLASLLGKAQPTRIESSRKP